MRRARLHSVIGLALLGTGVSAAPAGSGEPPPAPVAALWAQHNEIDELDRLPHPYQCDELYYKYRDVLLRVGARPGMKIYTYGCIRQGKPTAGSTRVDLTYSVPRALPDPNSHGEILARRTSVRLAPGTPKSLTAEDCVLLDEMRQTVLASIVDNIDAQDLHCDDHRRARHYSLTVQTLVPVTQDAGVPSG